MGKALHVSMQFILALMLVAVVGLGALSWRLSQRPLDVPWLAQRLADAVNADSQMHILLGGAELAWEGFREGVDRPLDIRLHNVTVTDQAGVHLATLPRVEVSLSIGWLLIGRLIPRAIEVDGARLHVVHAADGALTFNLGDEVRARQPGQEGWSTASMIVREFSRPAAIDHSVGRRSRWSQLERVRIRDAAISVEDSPLAATWRVLALNVALRREPKGGVDGKGEAKLTVGDQSASLTLSAKVGENQHTQIDAQLSRVTPAALASQFPFAAQLRALDAPVDVSATVELDPDLHFSNVAATARVAAGLLHIGPATVPLLGATMNVAGTPDHLHLNLARLETASRPDRPSTSIHAQADLSRDAKGGVTANGVLDLDQVAFGDLPTLWPEGLGGDGARIWVTQNVTDGVARNGHVEVALSASSIMSDVTVTHIEGGIEGHGVAVHWLRPVPPIEKADARLTLLTPDSLEVAVTTGRQAGGKQGGLQIRGGAVTITGLNDHDQFANIEADLAGTMPDLLTLLQDPKIKLLDRSPLRLQDVAGQLSGKISLPRLPLSNNVAFDSLQIRTDAHVTGLRVPAIAGGQDLDAGEFAVGVTPDGLHADGSAQLAGIPAQIVVDMDFRSGPPTQVLQKVAVSGDIDHRQLRTFGVDLGGQIAGPIGVSADLSLRRDGMGDIAIKADLERSALQMGVVNFTKPVGQPSSATARIALAGQRIAAIEAVHVEAPGLQIDGAADFAVGDPALLRLKRIVIGKDTDAAGEVRVPSRPDEPWIISVSGASLDASAAFRRSSASSTPDTNREHSPGPRWLLDARFDRVSLGPGRIASDVVAHAENDGQVIRSATLRGAIEGGTPFQIAVEPRAEGRRLSAGTRDAGRLLRLLDVIDTMQGGMLAVEGVFDDKQPTHPLTGTAEIQDFRIRNAPVLAKLLQAMTLYGLVEIAQGPGLGFSKLVAPFRYAGDTLTLSDARAFSASLGMTAKGRIELGQQTIDMQGTIVPAYFFNTLLGRIPLLGKLFSPEQGGGVFAATYLVRGKLSNPDLSINPLAALTPGVLRGLFGLFDRANPAVP